MDSIGEVAVDTEGSCQGNSGWQLQTNNNWFLIIVIARLSVMQKLLSRWRSCKNIFRV